MFAYIHKKNLREIATGNSYGKFPHQITIPNIFEGVLKMFDVFYLMKFQKFDVLL